MKTCTQCFVEKAFTDFYFKKADHSQYASACKQCTKDNLREHNRLYTANKRKLAKEAIYEYFETHPCVDCKEADPLVLQFDHVRGEKKGDVSRMKRHGVSIEVLMAEIRKCDVRCANCHQRRTTLAERHRVSQGILF